MSYQENYQKWLASPVVAATVKEELQSLSGQKEELEDRFSSMLSFGTAGLRGIMRNGLNGMNIYTVRYATQGLADLIQSCGEPVGSGVTIAYDSRHHSREFAKEAARVLAANGIHVNLFDALRPTPELSFALRETGSIAGINITASHNTKEYNGYKVYWSDGAQLPPEHADQVAERISRLDIFDDVRTMDESEAIEQGRITMLGDAMDEAYMEQVMKQSVCREEVKQAGTDVGVVYTPFHGTGYRIVPELLRRLGMKKVLTVPEQMIPDGEFPTVKSPNPEYLEGFALAVRLAEKNDIDLIIGTDPDGDRCGVVVRNKQWYEILTGNQIGVLLLEYLITSRRERGILADNSAVVKSIVSTIMANRICEKQDVTLFETLTGFKFIGEKIKEFEQSGEYTFLFGFEESNGYLTGTYARDKDAMLASMLIAEMACYYRVKKNQTLYEAMQALYERYGYYLEEVVSVVFDGFDASARMDNVMKRLRSAAPVEIGLPVTETVDYLDGPSVTGLPRSNVLYYHLAEGCSAVVRPSGTEPKIKLYVMAQGEDRTQAESRLKQIREAGKTMLC